jgi:hypothetical protein
MDLPGTGGAGLALNSQARSKSFFLWLRIAFGTAFGTTWSVFAVAH